MEEKNQHLDALADIRNMMERSSKFLSLSGLSGIFAGIFALIGAFFAFYYLKLDFTSDNYLDGASYNNGKIRFEFVRFFLLNAMFVLIMTLGFGIYFTVRKANKNNQSVWNNSSKRLLVQLMIPLIAGDFSVFVLFYHGFIGLIAPVTLIFYGLALINASKFTIHDIQFLGILEIIIGLISCIYIGYGLLFWALGFGMMHIIYGTIMYFKYEK